MSEMWEANLTFKREEREGVVPVGTYLSEAAGRLGIRTERKCVPFENVHFCQLSVLKGAERLSEPTAHESEFLAAETAAPDERLGCQTKITEPGEIEIMTKESKSETSEEKAEEAAKEYTKEFAELPLEKKIAQLVQLEAIALGETMSFVINSPFLIFEKAMDVMAEFGLKKEARDKQATRPAEHAAEANDDPAVEAVDESQDSSGTPGEK
jgi:ferredoxin